MRSRSQTRSTRSQTIACGLLLVVAAVLLPRLPAELFGLLQKTVRDSLTPGHRLILAARQQLPGELPQLSFGNQAGSERAGGPAGSRELTTPADVPALNQLEEQNRQLLAENAALRKQLEMARRESALPVELSLTEPLLMPEMTEARLLGQQAAGLWREGGLLDQGQNAGIRESSLVLAGEAPLVDLGASSGLKTGQSVSAGRTILGRIDQTGRWTSSLLPVTDPRYRGLAQLVRRTPSGTVYGGQGILEGRGDGPCTLRFVDSTEPVTVGDAVFTAETEDELPWPMFYGRVIRAELPPGAAWWEIDVEPASRSLQPASVQVLTTVFRPTRQATGEAVP